MYAAVVGYYVRRQVQGSAFMVRTLLRDNVDSAETFLATFGFKRYLLSFRQGFETTGLDGGMMHEYVITTVRRTDESKAFTIVKPLYCTCSHTGYLF
jgi:hypothetical protein